MGSITNPFAPMGDAGEDTPKEAEEAQVPAPDAQEDIASTPDEHNVPAGTAKEVMEWVGDDKYRAQKALDVEEAKGDDGRKGLKRDLSAMLEN